VGSMRSIQLKRANEAARAVDLYSVLLQGDRSRDYSLQAGDVIFVPPVGHTVEIEGEVKRPAIYEYPNTLTLSEVIRLAGGLSATAYSGEITVDRVKRDGSREALHVDLAKHQGDGLKINDGDRLQIGRVLDAVENTVELTGWVKRPRAVPFRAGMHVGELVPSVEALEHNPDLTYGLIARESATDHHLTFLPFVPSRLFDGIGTAADPELQLRDKVLFFSKDEPRTGLLDPLLRRLREEPRAGVAPPIVTVNGEVAFPGSYPLTEGMTVKDLVSVAGGIHAITNPTAELAHFDILNQESRSSRVESVRLDGDGGATSRLSPYDVLTVRPVERSETARWMIQLDGAVRFPGTYVISDGEALVSVLKRAGGFASDANPEGLVLIREDARRNEQAQLDLMTERLSHELSLKTISNSNSDSITDKATAQGQVVAAQGLLAELKSKRAIGRVALPSTGIAALQSGASYDISMLGGDRIVVPRRAGTVTVIGEVLSPGAFAIASGHDGRDFIRLAGGVTRDADEKRAYVVGPDGLAQPFSTLKGRKMREGDTVVVPTNLKKLPPLPMWAAITQILSNMVITAAAIKQL
jgi:polysaccharide biosynthesis/export protein